MNYSGPRAFQSARSSRQLPTHNPKTPEKFLSRPISSSSKRSITKTSETEKQTPLDTIVHEVQYGIDPSREVLDQPKPTSKESRRSGINKEVEIKEAFPESPGQKNESKVERPASQLSRSMASLTRLSQERPFSGSSLQSRNRDERKMLEENQSVSSKKSLTSRSSKNRPGTGLSRGSRSIVASTHSEKPQEKETLSIYVRELEELLRFERLKRIQSEEKIKQLMHRS